ACRGRAFAAAAVGVVLPETPEEAGLVELLREDVRTQSGDAVVEARAGVRHQLEHRAAELHDPVLLRADHEPRAAGRLAPPPPALVHAPPAVHPQVRVEREVAVEA